MTGEAPTAFVTELTPNDVILGRGAGPSQFVGNRQFRSLAEQRKEEYILAPDHWAKQKVARAILNHIHELGGRFLKEAVKDEKSGKGKAWQVVEESVALEKCKQTLRQNREKHDVGGNNEDDNGVLESGGGVSMSGEELRGDFTLKRNIDSLTQQADSQLSISGWGYDGVMAPVLPSMLADVDAHRFLVSLTSLPPPMASTPFHPSQFDPQGQHFPHAHLPSACRSPHVILGESYYAAYERYSVDNILHSQARDLLPRMTEFGAPEQGQAPERSGQEEGLGDHNLSNTLLNDEVADFLLSTIEQPGRPKFTEQQEAMERATMTDEDRAAALCDLFGKSCSMSIHGGKKPKRDLDPESIDFLVKQMRLEIERIPLERKQALMEALQKCRADEFSDARLERFLRCDGMNVKLGAQRFVNYWESRREVFGPEKYLLRMTLSEALRDDLLAVEAGIYRLLPHVDSSGRQLLVWEPRRNTKEGYTSESLLRALWYTYEVASRENTHAGSGIVVVLWGKDSTIWDYDRKVDERMLHFDVNSCLPVMVVASHVCSSPGLSGLTIRLTKPIMYALMDKRVRSRNIIHIVPESQVPRELLEYGILEGMLPTEMGGTLQLNQLEWIANRMALELEDM